MGLLGTIIKTTLHMATLPVDMVKDVATMGGTLTGEQESSTERKLRRLKEDSEEFDKEVDRL